MKGKDHTLVTEVPYLFSPDGSCIANFGNSTWNCLALVHLSSAQFLLPGNIKQKTETHTAAVIAMKFLIINRAISFLAKILIWSIDKFNVFDILLAQSKQYREFDVFSFLSAVTIVWLIERYLISIFTVSWNAIGKFSLASYFSNCFLYLYFDAL